MICKHTFYYFLGNKKYPEIYILSFNSNLFLHFILFFAQVSKSGRQLVMEKLMVAAAGKMESRVILLTNMVGPEDVDEDLQEDVEQECNKYGKVDHIVIYQVRGKA